MNITTYSPALVLLFVAALLWILMDVHFRELTPVQKWLVPLLIVVLAVFNHILRSWMGSAAYGSMIFLTMHVPFILIFLFVTKCGIIKMVFMIFSAVVFMAPTILIGNFVRRALFVGSSQALLLSNLVTYGIILLLAQFVFRKGFNYLVKYGDTRFFLRFSFIPLLYYIYLFSVKNLDFSSLNSLGGYIVRALPTLFVFAFYFLLPNIYKELSEKRDLDTATAALTQKLDAAEEQIALLNDAQTRTAIYQHDMRHHLTMIEGLLTAGKPQQAEEYIKKVHADVEAVTPKRFCENEIVNLLCSSFSSKAERMGIQLTIEARLPKVHSISDTELCAVMSNGLENALNAVAKLKTPDKWVEFYCETKRNKLLIEIKNPYSGEVMMQDGLPVSQQADHGYGCHSIRTIAQRHHGLCSFEADSGIFTLRVALPEYNKTMQRK